MALGLRGWDGRVERIFGSQDGWACRFCSRAVLAACLATSATYAVSGIVLATALATAPHPQYDFVTYLTVIYAAYAPTQLPIAIGEMLITGLAFASCAS